MAGQDAMSTIASQAGAKAAAQAASRAASEAASRAASKAASRAASRAVSRAASKAASRAASRAVSRAASKAVSRAVSRTADRVVSRTADVMARVQGPSAHNTLAASGQAAATQVAAAAAVPETFGEQMQRYATIFVAVVVMGFLMLFLYKMSVERFTGGMLIPVVALTPPPEKK